MEARPGLKAATRCREAGREARSFGAYAEESAGPGRLPRYRFAPPARRRPGASRISIWSPHRLHVASISPQVYEQFLT